MFRSRFHYPSKAAELVDRYSVGETADQFHQTRFIRDRDTDSGELLNEIRLPGAKRKLR
jgi:hypothetical protein